MKKEELKSLTTETLIKKQKGLKTFIGIFVALILALGFFLIRDYLKNGEFFTPELTIWICTVGGMVCLFPELKAIKAELKNRI